MSEILKPCPFCDVNEWKYQSHFSGTTIYQCEKCGTIVEEGVINTRPIEDALNARNRLLDCKIAQLEAELKITDELLKEATEAIGAVVACCTYNSNDDAKIGIYGIDQKAFTRIDQFITHYNDAVPAGKVSVDVKRELTDAEITRLENRFADTKACNGRLVEQLTAENKRLKAVLNEWDMAWLTDCIAPQPNGNEAFGLDEGLVLCARMMKPILEETRLLLGKAEVVR
jgi:hypothetical protein